MVEPNGTHEQYQVVESKRGWKITIKSEVYHDGKRHYYYEIIADGMDKTNAKRICKSLNDESRDAMIEELRSENDRLREENTMHRDKARGDYWPWQGDSYDNLDSIVCPVLIRPEALSAMLASRDAENERLKRAIGSFGTTTDFDWKVLANLDEQERRIEELMEALRGLVEEQNNEPPLVRDAVSWQKAYDRAVAVLKEQELSQ